MPVAGPDHALDVAAGQRDHVGPQARAQPQHGGGVHEGGLHLLARAAGAERGVGLEALLLENTLMERLAWTLRTR